MAAVAGGDGLVFGRMAEDARQFAVLGLAGAQELHGPLVAGAARLVGHIRSIRHNLGHVGLVA